METFGGIHGDAIAFLREIVQESQPLGAGPAEMERAQRALSRVKQELSICMQRWNAEVVAQWARLIHKARGRSGTDRSCFNPMGRGSEPSPLSGSLRPARPPVR